MTMVANNYLDEGRPHREVIEMMALGFTGKLQQWWNNCLTEVSKEDIKYAINGPLTNFCCCGRSFRPAEE